MSFNLQNLDDKVSKRHLGSVIKACHVELVVDDFRERLIIPLDYWSLDDYRNQWKDAARRLLKTGNSCLVTEMFDPLKPSFMMQIWPMYKDGDVFHMYSGYLSYGRIKGPFSIEAVYEEAKTWRELSDDGDKPSEWTLHEKDILDFLKQPNAHTSVSPNMGAANNRYPSS